MITKIRIKMILVTNLKVYLTIITNKCYNIYVKGVCQGGLVYEFEWFKKNKEKIRRRI